MAELTTPPAAVAAHVEALNLTGLGYAVRRLLGTDPLPVASQFAMWARTGAGGLPPVTRAYWSALAPLSIGRPQSPAAAVCDQVLRGRERDHDVARKAAADCAAAGKAQFRPLPDVAGHASADALRRRALVKAVKDYWRALGAIYGDVRTPVVQGDLPGAVAILRRAEPELRRIVEQVAVLATGVAGQSAQETADLQPIADGEPIDEEARSVISQAGGGEDAVSGEGDVAGPRPGGDTLIHVESRATAPLARSQAGSGAEAFARRERLREEPAPTPRPLEVLSTKPVPNRWALPIVYLIVVAAVALYVIFAVLNAPNPLTS